MQQNIIGAVDEVTTTMPPALLVSATYDSQKKSAVLKFYEPISKKILLWTDNTGHKPRSEEHTSDSSHVKISYAVFCLKKKKKKIKINKKKTKIQKLNITNTN